jgi:hypothetical protein
MFKWIGTIAGIVGSVLVAANSGLQVYGYIAFLTGSVAWLYASVDVRDKAGIVQWGFFSCVNLWGIVNYVS